MARRALSTALALFAALTPLVSADVEFTSPKAGDKLTGGAAITIAWQDSNTAPALSELTTYQIFLCAGGNDANSIIQLLPITQSAVAFSATGNKAAGTIGATIGASTPLNAYFLMILSTVSTGGTVTNFSPRFSLTGMTGSFPQSVIDAMKTVTGTDGPDRIDGTANAAPANPADGAYGVAYTMQTGLTRYAPMQPVPPTKIVKKSTAPLFPTSGVSIATTFLDLPQIQTTITQSQTFSVSSRANTAAAAPMPSDDMAKFLNRWKD